MVDHGHESSNDARVIMVKEVAMMHGIDHCHGSSNDAWLAMVMEVAMMHGWPWSWK